MANGYLSLDESFPHRFECEYVEELLPSAISHYYYPAGSTKGGKDGVMVRVVPHNNESWLGTFAHGDLAPNGKTGLYSWPNDTTLCVVARGEGYLVRVDEPLDWWSVSVHPVIDVRPIPSHEIVVFANYTKLIAYGAAGVVWRTQRLGWDSFDIIAVTADSIKGRAWDIRCDDYVLFDVDLKTGQHTGGIEED